MACLGFYLPAGQQPIPVRQEVVGLASSRPDSFWLVIETAPRNTALPIPDELMALYAAERTWTLYGVTLIHAQLRGLDAVSYTGDQTIRSQ